MDTEKKKPILLGIIVVCLVVAGGITLFRTVGSSDEGIGSIPKGEMMWVQCSNQNCNSEYEMEKRDYYTSIEQSPSKVAKCTKCGEETLFEAIKCEKCGIVFAPGSVSGEVRDRCPECGFSKLLGDTKTAK